MSKLEKSLNKINIYTHAEGSSLLPQKLDCPWMKMNGEILKFNLQ